MSSMEFKLLGSRNENMPLKDERDASADERHLRVGNETLGDEIARLKSLSDAATAPDNCQIVRKGESDHAEAARIGFR